MRKIIKIMDNWTFTDKDGNKTEVTLPHTWNALDGQDGGNDYYRGTNLYETILSKPEFDAKKEKVYLQFNGVNASADVMINDEKVCHHDGGYSTFRVDITKHLLTNINSNNDKSNIEKVNSHKTKNDNTSDKVNSEKVTSYKITENSVSIVY